MTGRSRRGTRRGFTLLEVIVAITLTGLVAGLAFGAAQAGIDVRARLDRVQREETSAAALRELLHDALRHAETGAGADDTTFALAASGRDPSGVLLRIATRGVLPPLGTGGRWAVSLAPTSAGLMLVAVPAEGVGGSAVRLVAPTVVTAEVRVLDRAGDGWLAAWDRPAALPAAVRVRFLDAAGRDVVPALVARTRPAGSAEEAP